MTICDGNDGISDSGVVEKVEEEKGNKSKKAERSGKKLETEL